MARKRRTTRRKTGTATTRRKATKRKKNSNNMANFFVPLFFIFCIVCCLGFLTFVGYRSVTASSFFDMKSIKIEGTKRSSEDEIKKIIKSETVKSGVWNADLDSMKREIGKQKFVKKVSVSRVLPNTIRVIVNERIPQAVVRIEGRDFWVDEDALVLSRISTKDKRPFTMFGWDNGKSLDATEKNKKRVKRFIELRQEWKKFDLASRVKAVDLSDLKDPRAIVSESGKTVTIYLGEKDFAKRLQKGLEHIAGRGQEIETIDVVGARPVITDRNS